MARPRGLRGDMPGDVTVPVDRGHTDGNGRAATDAEASLAPAVTRAVAVLDALAAEPGVAAGTSELSRRFGLPKSSIANICAALVEAGLLRRAGAGFRLGRRLAELGGAYLSAVDQVQEFYDACDEPGDGLGGDDAARHPGRHRGHLHRPARRPPADPARLRDRATAAGELHGHGQGGAGGARCRRAGRAPARHPLVAHHDGATRIGRSMRCWRISSTSGRAAMPSTTRRRRKA